VKRIKIEGVEKAVVGVVTIDKSKGQGSYATNSWRESRSRIFRRRGKLLGYLTRNLFKETEKGDSLWGGRGVDDRKRYL